MVAPIFIHSAAEFRSVVVLKSPTDSGTPESLVLEFKGQIDGWNGKNVATVEQKKEICRDIAQFANTLGGCLLVGVEEELASIHGRKVASSLKSVMQPETLKAYIECMIANYSVSSTFSHTVVPLAVDGFNILAINVPPSRHLVSVWDRNAGTVEYLRRTSHGKEYMNPDEVERHLMDGSRAAKLALNAAIEQATSDKVDAGGAWEGGSHGGFARKGLEFALGQLTDHWFELISSAPNTNSQWPVTIPYGVVREAWVNASGVLTLLLSVRIVFRDNKLSLEPYQ